MATEIESATQASIYNWFKLGDDASEVLGWAYLLDTPDEHFVLAEDNAACVLNDIGGGVVDNDESDFGYMSATEIQEIWAAQINQSLRGFRYNLLEEGDEITVLDGDYFHISAGNLTIDAQEPGSTATLATTGLDAISAFIAGDALLPDYPDGMWLGLLDTSGTEFAGGLYERVEYVDATSHSFYVPGTTDARYYALFNAEVGGDEIVRQQLAADVAHQSGDKLRVTPTLVVQGGS